MTNIANMQGVQGLQTLHICNGWHIIANMPNIANMQGLQTLQTLHVVSRACGVS